MAAADRIFRSPGVCMSDLRKVARVLKSNGTDGELVLGLMDIFPDDMDIEEPVFIFYDGLPVPFFIESASARGKGKYLVRLTGIKSHDDAMEAAGKDVFMMKDAIDESADDEGFSFLENWTLSDESGRAVGRISGYMDIPGNPCIEVLVEDKEKPSCGSTVLIPLHDDLIVSADGPSQTVSMIIPEGLL